MAANVAAGLRAPATRLRDIDLLLRNARDPNQPSVPLPQALPAAAAALRDAHAARLPAAAQMVRATREPAPVWCQGSTDEPDDAIFASPLSHDEARRCVARWHGFAEWTDVLARSQDRVDLRFEQAADAIVDGDADALRLLLSSQPGLARACSPFGHHATLLHHVTANGIEHSRQWQSPANAVELAEILLGAGADPAATCSSYSADDTVLTLLLTSDHPAKAGVQAGLVEALCKAGVNPNGPNDDGAPLWTAISSGYGAAARSLVRCGARLDNIVYAAAVGDLPVVQTFFDAQGRLQSRPSASTRNPNRGVGHLDPNHLLEYALIYAAGLGDRQVVEHLLTKNPDLSVKEPIWNCTAVQVAQYHRRDDIVGLLKTR
jgi:hypothetical protein